MHTGKAHGACPNPPCGDGKGDNTFTSGFEGPWTTNPARWGNDFYNNLFDFDWELITGPGGAIQWKPKNKSDGSDGPDIMMLTSDLALAHDPAYRKIAREYADDIEILNKDFAAAWYKLVTADMGPSSRCIGDMIPKHPEPFQNDLPAPPKTLPDYKKVRKGIEKLMFLDNKKPDAFIHLAYQCASTYRKSDYHGGCNGARIRFSPEKDWSCNDGTQEALAELQKVKDDYPEVSYADLIVLAGVTALEKENKDLELPFCGGYVDAHEGHNSKDLRPRKYKDAVITVLDDYLVKGLTKEEGVALACRKSVGSKYYKKLLAEDGEFSEEELALIKHHDLKMIVKMYADDEKKLLEIFTAAWTKMMTADRYKVSTTALTQARSISSRPAGNSNKIAFSIPLNRRTTVRMPVKVFGRQPQTRVTAGSSPSSTSPSAGCWVCSTSTFATNRLVPFSNPKKQKKMHVSV